MRTQTMQRRGVVLLVFSVALAIGWALAPVAAQQDLTLLARAELAEDRDFLRRVQMASTRTATTLLQADPESPGYLANVTLAKAFLRDPQPLSARLGWVVASSDSVDGDISDADLLALIAQRWPAFAAVLVP